MLELLAWRLAWPQCTPGCTLCGYCGWPALSYLCPHRDQLLLIALIAVRGLQRALPAAASDHADAGRGARGRDDEQAGVMAATSPSRHHGAKCPCALHPSRECRGGCHAVTRALSVERSVRGARQVRDIYTSARGVQGVAPCAGGEQSGRCRALHSGAEPAARFPRCLPPAHLASSLGHDHGPPQSQSILDA